VAAIAVPLVLSATSPLLAWRRIPYIIAGFAGVVALALVLVQPLLIGEHLPGLTGVRGRRVHRWLGVTLVLTVVIHVGGLWITSPPDVVDVLLFRSPTPFSAWGAIAMWAVLGAAFLAVLRRRLRARTWCIGHTLLVAIAVAGGVIHALLIEGTMETISKVLLCVLVVVITAIVLVDLRVWSRRRIDG